MLITIRLQGGWQGMNHEKSEITVGAELLLQSKEKQVQNRQKIKRSIYSS